VSELILERRRDQVDKTGVANMPGVQILLTPPISEDYWAYRVIVADGQAVVGFPKFGTIGVGFADEHDGKKSSWNTNLPYTSDAEQIADHIWRNRGSALKAVGKRDGKEAVHALIVEAIRLIQEAATADRS
jgi:hypothetical protein